MPVGRAFPYSDTQRYRVGPNHLQLPVNQAKNAEEDHKRLADLGNNPPRDVSGLTMTHCVPDARHTVTR